MSWTIACFCGNVIDTPWCPYCGSRLPASASNAGAPDPRVPASEPGRYASASMGRPTSWALLSQRPSASVSSRA